MLFGACFQPTAPATDLLIEWLFSGDASDSSGHGRNGSVVGATLVADRHGNPNSAYEFADDDGDDNGDGYIRTVFPDLSPNPGDTFAISVSLWARADWSVENLSISSSGSCCGVDIMEGVGNLCRYEREKSHLRG